MVLSGMLFISDKWSGFIRRHWLSLAFVAGFITDFLLLNRVDNLIDNIILLFYVILATVAMWLFYVGVAERGPVFLNQRLVKFMPLLMQYAFGGLLSGMLIFYGRSGDWLASAPFLLLLALAMVLNEVIQKRSSRLLYNVSVYFIGLFSYCVLIVPVWLGRIGDWVFVGSGLLALLITVGLIKLLKTTIPNFLELQKRFLVFIIGVLYAILNGLYFYNFIPPIPLSLIELSIVQGVEKTTTGYLIEREDKPWYKRYSPWEQTFTPLPGEGAYCFARVFAPTSIRTDITHRWERVDAGGTWQEVFNLSYGITSDNENGYRGYTVARNLSNGRWRCTVENQRGQVLGREVFTVDLNRPTPTVVTVVE